MPLPVPPDLEQALAEVPSARRGFDALPPQGKDRWIAWIQRARLRPARRRRIGHALAVLGRPPRGTGEAVVEEYAPPRPIWPWVFALALLLLIAALLIWLLVYRDNGNGRHANVVLEKAAVPSVVGEKRAQAVRRVKAAHLTPATQKRHAAEPRGVVVDQRPAAGETVKGGSVVTLVVSSGPPKVPVPKVTGLAAADAVTKLQAAKLSAKLVDVRSAKVPGTVVTQKPAGGAKAPQGSKVTLSVSKGGGKVTVPAVVGETAAQAASDLAAAGLKAGTTAVVSDQPRGNVVAQSPGGGARATKGTTVELKVSKGARAATTPPPPATTQQATTAQAATAQATTAQAAGVAVPALVGQGIASALGALERAGLRATVRYQSSQTPVGQVRGQNPAAGARVPAGSRVQVNVSEGPNPGNPTQAPDETGQDQQTATGDLQQAGFRVVVIQRSGTGQSPGTVVEQQPAAGATLTTGDYVALYVAR